MNRTACVIALVAAAMAGASATKASGAFGSSRTGATPSTLVDNDRVTVFDVTPTDPTAPRPAHGSVWISVSRPGEVRWVPAGQHGDAAALGGRAIVVDVKDTRPAPLSNTSGYPLAFPRPGKLKKLLDNDRVIVWDYTWTPNEPTPMHFHDKDVVVLYVADGALKSTTPDGQSTTNEFSNGTVRFNARNRVHTEVLARGAARAIITELK